LSIKGRETRWSGGKSAVKKTEGEDEDDDEYEDESEGTIGN
jgi:hypothetical protein